MSHIPQALQLQEEDVRKMLACNVHIGDKNVSPTMTRYVWKRNSEGVHIIDLRKTWEKLVLAARAIVAMENPADVCAVSLTVGRSTTGTIAQRAVLKFSSQVGARHLAGRYTPGTFTNRIQSNFFEPRLLVVSDPIKDFQPILEASYVNMPVIALADVDAPTKHIDIVIPCNTKSKNSVALMWWLLTREVLRLKGVIPRDKEWDVMVDMFLFRQPEEAQEKSEKKSSSSMQFHSDVYKGKDPVEEDEYDHRRDEEDVDKHPTTDTVGEPGAKGEWSDWVDNDKQEEDW